MMASARSRRCCSLMLSRRVRASSAASGLGSAVWDRACSGSAPRRPRHHAVAANPKEPMNTDLRVAGSHRSRRCRRSAIDLGQDAQLVPRREAPAARPVQVRATRQPARNDRRPTAFLRSRPVAAEASVMIFGITTRRCSYALKAKLPGGRCLTIVGTEGDADTGRRRSAPIRARAGPRSTPSCLRIPRSIPQWLAWRRRP